MTFFSCFRVSQTHIFHCSEKTPVGGGGAIPATALVLVLVLVLVLGFFLYWVGRTLIFYFG
jgi:hypothetical protein